MKQNLDAMKVIMLRNFGVYVTLVLGGWLFVWLIGWLVKLFLYQWIGWLFIGW